MTLAEQLPPERTPGAMQEHVARELPDGSHIEFVYAPAGWLKKDGEPRRRPWRKYYHVSRHQKRTELVSVTTLLDAIMPSKGLVYWSEDRGIEGAVRAVRLGEITADTPLEDTPRIVRSLRLGAEAHRDEAAGRGLNVHGLLEVYMRTGNAPRLADHPVEHHGFVRGLCSWLLARDPEPEVVEQLVCHPERGYAGRRDLVARCDGVRVGFDAKTQARAGIYSKAHIQLMMYDEAGQECGDPPSDDLRVVVFAEDGSWREMVCEATSETVAAALAYYRALKPIDSLCERLNLAEKEARR